jgi:hypothetical protein
MEPLRVNPRFREEFGVLKKWLGRQLIEKRLLSQPEIQS